MFYTFNQNNSGGGFDYDESVGISHFVIVEADSAEEANRSAERVGLYFGGQGDCPCCGDRWYETWDDDGEDEPEVYGMTVTAGEAYSKDDGLLFMKWMKGFEGFIHYKDGKFCGFWKEA